jgi:glutamine amidotransferase
MIAIIDYGVGNLFSLEASFKKIGAETIVTSDPKTILEADRAILPGVGAFGDASDKLKETGISDVIKTYVKLGKPIMGICLGMQLLFEYSEEFGRHEGLSLLKGSVVPMKGVVPDEYKIPQIGWNKLNIVNDNPLFKYINNGEYVYFVHSFYAVNCDDSVIANTEYGADITAAVAKDNIYGCQFHPEKSGDVGLNILRGFLEV